MKTLLWIVAGAVIVTVSIWIYVTQYMNRGVIAELEQHPHGQRAAESLLLTLPSGRRIPVNYLEEDGMVFIGADGPWWLQFRGGAPTALLIRGEHRRGTGRVILDDPDFENAVFARLRPDVPKWLPDWLDGRLIVIELEPVQ